MTQQPVYILFAGVNGAGKSTLFKSNLWDKTTLEFHIPRVNSDEILYANGWKWEDTKAQLRAGKEALRLVKHCLGEKISFNQETTLTGHSIMRNVRQARQTGFRVVMYYVGVDDPEIAHRRIAHRILQGGHGVDRETVTRRALASINNLVKAVPLCDEVFLFDNTHLLKPVARLIRGDLVKYESESTDVSWPNEVILRLIEETRS